MSRTSQQARIAGTTLRALLAVFFSLSGVAKLTGLPVALEGFDFIAVPAWLVTLIGAAELLGAALILFRGYAALGAALLAALTISYLGFVVFYGAPFIIVAASLLMLGLLAFVIYAQRRRLRAAALVVSGDA